MIAFLLKQWQAVALVALLTFGVVEWKRHSAALVREGQAIERVRVADSTLAVLRVAQRKIDSVFVHDTLRFTKTRESVVTLRDTLNIHDTTEVKVFVERATEAVNDCTALLSSCKARGDGLLAQLTQERAKTVAAPFVAPGSCVATGATWGLVGVGLGFFAGRR